MSEITERMSEITERIQNFIQLGNEAKNKNDYQLANIAFVRALFSFFWDTGPWDTVPNLRFLYETQDEKGVGGIQQTYYDLLHIAVKDESLCIPVPMLTADALATVMKHGVVYIDRVEHCRSVEPSPTTDLEDELFQIKWNGWATAGIDAILSSSIDSLERINDIYERAK